MPRSLQPLASHLSLLYDLKRCSHYHLVNCRALLTRFVAVFDLLSEVPELAPPRPGGAPGGPGSSVGAASGGTGGELEKAGARLGGGAEEGDESGGGATPRGAGRARGKSEEGPRWSEVGARGVGGGGSVGAVLATQLADLVSDAHDLFSQFSET